MMDPIKQMFKSRDTGRTLKYYVDQREAERFDSALAEYCVAISQDGDQVIYVGGDWCVVIVVEG